LDIWLIVTVDTCIDSWCSRMFGFLRIYRWIVLWLLCKWLLHHWGLHHLSLGLSLWLHPYTWYAWLHSWHHRVMVHHRWLTNIDCRGIIRVEVCELLLETRALYLLQQLSVRSPSARILSYFSNCIPEALEELSTSSFHKPNLALSISRQRVKKRFSCATQVVCPEDWLVELF
jgi:hypothetical protein